MKKQLEQLKPTIQQLYQYLHAHPEVSWQEVNTTAFLADYLAEEGFAVKTFNDCTGLIVEVGEGKPAVGLRCDIDALWQEVNGEFQANHSCGHDAHMAMSVGTLLLLKSLGYQLPGRLMVIFQPAEEKGTGALKMIEKGLIDDLDFLYGVHLRPIQELSFGQASAGIQHGAAKFIAGEIIGEEAHGARPHLGKNAIEIGSSLIQALQQIHMDPSIPYSVKMTKFQSGGESSNIIPAKATFSIDVRAQTNEVMSSLTEKVVQACKGVEMIHGATIHLETKAETAAAIISDEASAIMKAAIGKVLGEEHAVSPIVTTGGEDFHFYTVKRPEVRAAMLGLGCDLKPGLHHPDMTFQLEALYSGIEILTETIIQTFEQRKG
ncbi:amidohydrolase [Bacillus sp. FJAT-27231]|uniref:M20 peptidase aminoacylase family protein n=1 Tax=Bacillus sp. FJAT-27231 TaxID=1679168 RepID=UPI000670C18C|nr:M20 peptidase aminoacylase family protein [Bacillus sp. FJAT-27231]KMY53409.1 amidohydrolase [Bacillus sp. FJAT-27231]